MKTLCDKKRQRILEAAGTLFAERPFHKVLLSDVARAAGVGKGTLYLYFRDKEALHMAVLERSLADLVDRLTERLSDEQGSPREQLSCLVREMVGTLRENRFVNKLLRGAVVGYSNDSPWAKKRMELRRLVERVIQRGVDQGVFRDAHPEFTAHYIPGMVRSICLFLPDTADPETVYAHARDFVLNALNPNGAAAPACA